MISVKLERYIPPSIRFLFALIISMCHRFLFVTMSGGQYLPIQFLSYPGVPKYDLRPSILHVYKLVHKSTSSLDFFRPL
uniref:Secreted protein n=1 Tax=Steinernema glaseri TaxID=37863 RepID=A0A1I7Y950_9BILA